MWRINSHWWSRCLLPAVPFSWVQSIRTLISTSMQLPRFRFGFSVDPSSQSRVVHLPLTWATFLSSFMTEIAFFLRAPQDLWQETVLSWIPSNNTCFNFIHLSARKNPPHLISLILLTIFAKPPSWSCRLSLAFNRSLGVQALAQSPLSWLSLAAGVNQSDGLRSICFLIRVEDKDRKPGEGRCYLGLWRGCSWFYKWLCSLLHNVSKKCTLLIDNNLFTTETKHSVLGQLYQQDWWKTKKCAPKETIRNFT